MNPQVPSSTYPNHFSLVTGVYPSVHGIVSNEFRDPRLNMTFTYKDPAVADLPEWWLSKPLWISAQEQGKKSGVCFWPGSEAEIQGSRPTYYRKFDSKMSMKARFDTLLEWIDLPVNERPSLFMTYYEKVDQMGHLYGTKSAELDVALQEFDDAFGQFINDLESRRIRDVVNILILSDHGMQDVSYHVDLIGEGLIKQNEIEHIDYTPLTYIRPVNKEMVPDLVERLKEGSKNRYNVFERKDLPEEWHLKDQERVSEIVVAFEPGYTAVSPTWKNMPKGAHGYYLNNAAGDLVNDDMRALFMVSSPRILQEKIFVKRYDNLVVAQPPNRLYNLEVKVFENLDVYPLMCNFLHILAAPNNGTTFLVDTLLNHS